MKMVSFFIIILYMSLRGSGYEQLKDTLSIDPKIYVVNSKGVWNVHPVFTKQVLLDPNYKHL